MAKFRKVTTDPGDSADEIWKKIRANLLVSQSVELVAVRAQGGQVIMEIRAWDGIRSDKSNEDKATPGKDY